MRRVGNTAIIHCYKHIKSTTVIEIELALPPTMWALSSAARAEAARLWNRMVKLHAWFRRKRKPWPSPRDFEQHFKGRFVLHSQTIQALTQRFFANITTTREDMSSKTQQYALSKRGER
jgi:putative transposase